MSGWKSSGRPVIWFVHALGDSSDVFEGLLGSGLQRTFDLAAPDWPGADDLAAQTVDDLDGLAGWLAATVDRHTPAVPVGFVGHSLGAAVAVKAVSKLDRVVGVFSIEGNLTPADAYFSGLAMEFEVPGEFRAYLLARIRDLAAGGQSSRHDALRRYHARLSRADPETLWRIGRSAKSASRDDALGEEYRALPAPTLYYWSPENTSRETRTYLRKHRLPDVVFTGGHWPMVEQPEETARQIAAFFEPLLLARSEGANP
jgi:pimeloyl-ACP methyl ester carboxylesterase